MITSNKKSRSQSLREAWLVWGLTPEGRQFAKESRDYIIARDAAYDATYDEDRLTVYYGGIPEDDYSEESFP